MIIDSFKTYKENTFSSLRIRNYRLYFIGQGISLCGTWMQTIGQSWLVLKLTGSGTALGLVTALQTLPVLLLGPMGGVITDRFSKRKLLFFTQTAFCLLALALGILVAADVIRIWMVYILALCLGLVAAIDNPTRQTFVHEMVGSENLRNAVTLNSTEINLARVIGPAIAGVLIAGTGMAVCFIINSLSFVAVLVCLFLMRGEELNIAEPIREVKGQLLKGFKYIGNTPVIRDVLIMMAIVGALSYEFQVSLPLLAKFTFRGNAGSYALLTSAMGIGAVLGGLFTAGRKRTRPDRVAWVSLAFGAAILLVSLAPSLGTAALAMVAVGACSLGFTSLGNSTLQLESEPEMRGRVMALWTVAFMGTTPIGGPIIGWIGEHANPRWSLVTGATAAVIAGGYGLMAMKRNYSKEGAPGPAR
jgi:MFS family permease